MRAAAQVVDSKRRLPKQERARRTVEAIVEATAQILQCDGSRVPLTTNHIARRAGVGISSLYQYFRNKEAILLALAKREMASHRDVVVSALAASPSRDSSDPARASVRALIAGSAQRHKARRIAMESVIAQGLGAEIEPPMREVTRALGEHAKRLAPEFHGALSDVSLFVLSRAVQGVIGAALRDAPELTESPELETALLRLFRGYLAQLEES